MTTRSLRARTVAISLMAFALAACTPSSADPILVPTPSTTTKSVTPPAPTATRSQAASPDPSRDRAEKEVRALVKRYYAVDEAIATDSRVPLNRYYEVAGGRYAQDLLRGAQTQRANGYRVSGHVRVGPTKLIELTAGKPTGRFTSAVVSVCLDVSDVEVVNRKNQSVVDAERADAYLERLTLRQEKYGWRAVDGENTEISECEE